MLRGKLFVGALFVGQLLRGPEGTIPPVTPSSGGGGGYARQVIHRQAPDDAEEIFLMVCNAFMRTQ